MSGSSGLSGYGLTSIFRIFDTDASEGLELGELKRMIRVLLKIKGASLAEPSNAAVNGCWDVLRPRLASFCRSTPDTMSLSEFLSAMRASGTLVDLEWITEALQSFFAKKNHAILNAEFPFVPTFEEQDLQDWHTLPPSLECCLPLDGGRKQACIPSRNWQVALRLSPLLYHPDGRMVQIKIHRTDSIADVVARIVHEWPGLKGRDFHPPEASACQLRLNAGRVYLFSERIADIENIYFLFKTTGFVLEPAGHHHHHEKSSYSFAGAAGAGHSAPAAPAAAAAPTAASAPAGSATPPPQPPVAASQPPAALLRCGDHLWHLRRSLHAETDRYRSSVEALEAALDLESDSLSVCAEQLGKSFQADREDLRQQIAGLRGEIAACRVLAPSTINP